MVQLLYPYPFVYTWHKNRATRTTFTHSHGDLVHTRLSYIHQATGQF